MNSTLFPVSLTKASGKYTKSTQSVKGPALQEMPFIQEASPVSLRKLQKLALGLQIRTEQRIEMAFSVFSNQDREEEEQKSHQVETKGIIT